MKTFSNACNKFEEFGLLRNEKDKLTNVSPSASWSLVAYPIELEQQTRSSCLESIVGFVCARFLHEIIGFDFAILALARFEFVKVAVDEVVVVPLIDGFVGCKTKQGHVWQHSTKNVDFKIV